MARFLSTDSAACPSPPWGMMDYASRELNDGEHHQYTETLSPRLFLLVTLLLSHALELALIVTNHIDSPQ